MIVRNILLVRNDLAKIAVHDLIDQIDLFEAEVLYWVENIKKPYNVRMVKMFENLDFSNDILNFDFLVKNSEDLFDGYILVIGSIEAFNYDSKASHSLNTLIKIPLGLTS